MAPALASVSDGIGSRIDFTSRQWLLGQDRTPQQQADMYSAVSAAEVAGSVEGIWFDHSYLLAPTEQGEPAQQGETGS